jgi:DNA polymerase-3 subunit alpha
MDKSELVACNKRVIESLIKAGAFDSFGHTRLSLIQIHEDAVDAVVPIKRKEAEGQFDLFGADSSDDQDDSTSPLAHLKFGTDEYPRKQMLSLEKEMLGLYVSSHPLDGAERILRKYAPRPIAVVLDDPPKEGELIVSGMISSIERRVNKNGLPWAITVIEDLDASIEVLFFPKSYEVLRDDLELDSAVCVKGRVNWREDKMAIFGDGVVPLDISDAEANPGADPPLVLGLQTKTLTPELIEELKIVFKSHEGQVAVHLEVQKRDRSKEMLVVENYRVQPTPSLFGDLKTIRGVTIQR